LIILKWTGDTVLHSWEVLAKILESPEAKGIICDIGMYVFPSTPRLFANHLFPPLKNSTSSGQ
jgi:hypothetical protein